MKSIFFRSLDWKQHIVNIARRKRGGENSEDQSEAWIKDMENDLKLRTVGEIMTVPKKRAEYLDTEV